ncbi:tRNA pseudouridine(55) synthase TruB [Tuanshanicoccus lijuaniae]|uniref:tRNA pseudouridine(55) synthase TruB n=1 Tax=Aerococcaceae bacterium zg-1292 TaxID=2774330 RepID=UPI0019380570|nr:tRNA pseudouridine(55) synthase TruB [Aerococcaceae bacterium zg-1292]QQA38177.1 tRNA pseudouridine(55) synthase TruB [Aerococcaceae bacterium zg-1292]
MRGLLPIWKEKGMTSHDVVFQLRKLLKMKRIGHTGTLDPDVEGVLLICLGEATKLVELLMDGQKEYVGEITLGFSTETEDSSGAVVLNTPVLTPVDTRTIDEKMQSFVGIIQQIPPYYSAVKVNGRRLYEYARQGETVERPVRQAVIHSFERINEPKYDATTQLQSWQFRVVCGKGTYVRTLAVDLGEALGYASHMSQLIRQATGGFDAQMALTLEQVALAIDNQTIDQYIYSIEAALSNFPRIDLSMAQFDIIKNGSVVPADYFGQIVTEPVAVFYKDVVKAIYQPHPGRSGFIKPLRMFVLSENEERK